MNRVLKILGLVVGAVVLLAVVAAVAVTMLFDPNDYKDEITAAVQDATGRQRRFRLESAPFQGGPALVFGHAS